MPIAFHSRNHNCVTRGRLQNRYRQPKIAIGATTHAHVELSAAARYFMEIIHEVAGEIRDELGQARP